MVQRLDHALIPLASTLNDAGSGDGMLINVGQSQNLHPLSRSMRCGMATL